jgi:putative ABC transport system permease protein
LQLDDLNFLKRHLSGIQSISAERYAWHYRHIQFQDQTLEVEVTAVSEDYIQTSGRKITDGRYFNATDYDRYRPVVVIDQLLQEQLFDEQNPLGQRLYANGKPHIIVGVMETKLRFKDDEPRGQMLIPLSLYMAALGTRAIGGLQIRPQVFETTQDMEIIEEKAKQLLEPRFPKAEFFTHHNADDILQQKETLNMASRGLLAVGAIALLVAGVGIANITIASVMERTPEIGLRRAIGATQRSIVLQFILEAVLMSLLGGIAAIIAVDSTTRVIANQFELPYNFEITTAGLSLGAAIFVGVGSSFLPALRASQIEPVQALRSRH